MRLQLLSLRCIGGCNLRVNDDLPRVDVTPPEIVEGTQLQSRNDGFLASARAGCCVPSIWSSVTGAPSTLEAPTSAVSRCYAPNVTLDFIGRYASLLRLWHDPISLCVTPKLAAAKEVLSEPHTPRGATESNRKRTITDNGSPLCVRSVA